MFDIDQEEKDSGATGSTSNNEQRCSVHDKEANTDDKGPTFNKEYYMVTYADRRERDQSFEE